MKNKYMSTVAVLTLCTAFLFALPGCGPAETTIESDPEQLPAETAAIWDLTEDEGSQEGGIKSRSQEEIQEELNQKVEEGMINISMNLNPVFADGEADGNLLIVNEEVNRYPQVVEIYLKDTDTLLYRSGGISVGHSVETGKLLVDLDAGNYPCVAYFNAINPDTNALVGRAGAEITISVLG